MKKIITLFLILFISFAYTAYSLKVFEIEETEKLSLDLKTEDPDADKLIYTFTEPLDNNGEWQTTYGDAGEYTSITTVSDGENEVSEEVLIIVNRKEAKPVIDKFLPKEDSVNIDEAKDIKFKVDVSDLNNDELSYKWLVNNEVVSYDNEMLFETNYQDAGEYTVGVVISDGVFNVSKEWNVNVNDIDLNNILDQIKDIIVSETETARLKLPNFKKYGLSYSISDPLGNDNKWKTDYDDAGEYTVKIKVKGKGFEGEKEVKIAVRDKDRAPELVGLKNLRVNENEQAVIELKAVDHDGDDIIFSVEDIPENAKLDGNVFTFNPGYDFVQKNSAFDYVLDKFRLLGRSVNIVFAAQSNKLSDEKNVKVTVKNTNRPFVLEELEDIEVDEGEEIVIDPKYNDPDNDRVSFSYSGFMNGDKKKTGFDDSGEYIVKVVATDDYFTETVFVNIKINDVNRKPVFDKLGKFEVKDGSELKIELSASDPDNDAVSFSAENLMKGAVLKDNLFVWKPGYVVNGTEKEFSVDFIVSDGINEATQKVKITVLNVNQAPEIISYSDNLVVLKNEPVLFEVDAVDGDGDELTYNWDFGFFSKYEGNNQHQRIFATSGSKKVQVTVSDGIESISKVWNVEVV
jgi:hypothetical protein|tara:strand:- start:3963 stop:5849 length:1887 start_codon:yes stop_codon:yes gene_type:complete